MERISRTGAPLLAQIDPCAFPGVGSVCDAAGDAAQAVARDVLGRIADQFLEGLVSALQLVTTFWVRVPTPGVSQDGAVGVVQDSTAYLVGVVGVLGLLVGLCRVVWSARGGPEAGDLARGLVRLAVLTSAGVPAVALLVEAGDQLAVWILQQATGGDLDAVFATLIANPQLGQLGAAVLLVIALVGVISAIGQVFLLLIRSGMVIVLTGALPVLAAGGLTETGRAGLTRALAWLLAFILYKPVAATIYSAAFAVMQSGDLAGQLAGLGMMTMAVLALPALMRLLTPAMSMVTSGSGGSVAAGGIAMASGAAHLAARHSGSGAAPSAGGSSRAGGAPGSGSAPSGATVTATDTRAGTGAGGSSTPSTTTPSTTTATAQAPGTGTGTGPGAGPSGAVAGSPTAGAAGTSGGAAAGVGAGSGAASGAASGSAAGPVGAVTGAAVATGVQVGRRGSTAVRDATGSDPATDGGAG